MNCAYCNSVIDDDSFFCDQCGEEVKLCENCGKPGKGKRCIHDGGKLVPASQQTVAPGGTAPNGPAPAAGVAGSGVSPAAPNTAQPGAPAQPTPQTAQPTGPAPQPTPTSQTAAPTAAGAQATPSGHAGGATAPGDLQLENQNLNIQLRIRSGETIGRTNGEHSQIFGSFPMISGTHARFDQAQGWTVTDLGSTNGTFVNGQPIPPHAPTAVTNNALIKFANVEFVARVPTGSSNMGGTVRM